MTASNRNPADTFVRALRRAKSLLEDPTTLPVVRTQASRLLFYANVGLGFVHAREHKGKLIALQERKLRRARHHVRILTVEAMRPGLSEIKRSMINDLERSARAEVRLHLDSIARMRGTKVGPNE